jgi:hypothetical protein
MASYEENLTTDDWTFSAGDRMVLLRCYQSSLDFQRIFIHDFIISCDGGRPRGMQWRSGTKALCVLHKNIYS